MRKEVLWAAGIGISFGLIIAFGAWRINSAIKPTPTPVTGFTPIPTPTSDFKITLDKPENEDVVTDSIVAVSGLTKANTLVTVSAENADYILRSNADGTFSQDTELIPGINQIKITAFDENGNSSLDKVLVVFSSSFQVRGSIGSSASSNASDEASIRQKVQEKVEAALNRPKAYIGTVTDITDSTIQIKTQKGEIRQISTSADSTAVVKGSVNTKSVKLTDIAIGDFVAAMGYINSGSVLSAQRILITDAVIEFNTRVVMADITAVTKDITTTSKVDGASSKVTPDKKTLIYDFTADKPGKIKQTDLSKDQTVVYVLIPGTQNTSILRSVFVVAKPQN